MVYLRDQQPVKMETSKKPKVRKYIVAVLTVMIGIWMIDKSGGQVYGAFIGIVFFIMAITSIVDQEYTVKFGST